MLFIVIREKKKITSKLLLGVAARCTLYAARKICIICLWISENTIEKNNNESLNVAMQKRDLWPTVQFKLLKRWWSWLKCETIDFNDNFLTLPVHLYRMDWLQNHWFFALSLSFYFGLVLGCLAMLSMHFIALTATNIL